MLQLPVDEIQIFSIDEELGTNFSMGRDAAWGPRIVFDSANDEYRGNLYLTDLTDGTLEVIAKAAGQDRAWTPDISGDRVAWVEFHYDDDRSFQGNSSWRLMLKDLASGDVRQIDSGVHTRLSGGAAPPAIIRIDGDHIAYAIEHKRPGYPLGWRIVLQSLTSGEVEREFDTELDIFKLDIAGASIAYSEGQTDPASDFRYGTRLMLSTTDHPEPVEVARDAYEVAISGDRLTWMEDRQAGLDESPIPITPVIMTATLSDLVPRQVSITTRAPPAPPGWGSPRFGGMYPAAGDDLVAWQDDQTDGTWDGQLYRVALWDDTTQMTYQLEPTNDPLYVGVEGGWLTWNSDVTADGREISHSFHGIPISEIPLASASP